MLNWLNTTQRDQWGEEDKERKSRKELVDRLETIQRDR